MTAFPELVVGKRVAVTAIDGGPLRLSPEELLHGWEQRDQVAVSPRMAHPSSVPAAGHGDEWYVFVDVVPEFANIDVFVNYGRFSPLPVDVTGWDDTWDWTTRRQMEARQDQFWAQLRALEPWAYIAGGDLLTLVTKSEDDRDRAAEHLRRRNRPEPL